jgi:alcohol dehydrogenase (NADP+)
MKSLEFAHTSMSILNATLRNQWPVPIIYPAICGHEIVGTVAKAGKESGHQVGSRVGIGAQAGAW